MNSNELIAAGIRDRELSGLRAQNAGLRMALEAVRDMSTPFGPDVPNDPKARLEYYARLLTHIHKTTMTALAIKRGEY